MKDGDEIRVLRLIEYRYESVGDMEEDMTRWTLQSAAPTGARRFRGWRSRMSSTHLPPQVVRGLFVAENGPTPPTAAPMTECPRCGEALPLIKVPTREQAETLDDSLWPTVPGGCTGPSGCGWPTDPQTTATHGGFD